MNDLKAIHPGEVLLEDFMKPLGLTQYRVAKDVGSFTRQNQPNCARKAFDYSRYSTSSCPVF